MTISLPTHHILQNEYEILSILGQGGFGITYLAKDINLNYQVVIKEFLPQDMAGRKSDGITVAAFTKDAHSYEHLLKRFSQEAQLLAKMRHPNIVKVIRFFRANNTAYFVMEYAKGQTLKEYLKQKGTMSEEEILSIMMPILEGTKYIHEQGFLHRDIAPDNIYLKEDGMPILIDFGAARDAIAEESKNISSIVKEGYSAPEQYTTNNKQKASADIYALGAVFYRMITGKVPPGAAHRQTALLNNDPDPVGGFTETYKKHYSSKLLHAVKKAMHIRASDRFASVSEFQKALLGDVAVARAPRPVTQYRPDHRFCFYSPLVAGRDRLYFDGGGQQGSIASYKQHRCAEYCTTTNQDRYRKY
jgi:serine/threonine protein kinase